MRGNRTYGWKGDGETEPHSGTGVPNHPWSCTRWGEQALPDVLAAITATR